eukprot:GDKI01034473.1.p1 GENE.GDKI01034473.1~~GDKI01034473.1.p1  ORF type:complete len:312 (+),score=58.41 GDKI01034473.1:140-1075(+)
MASKAVEKFVKMAPGSHTSPLLEGLITPPLSVPNVPNINAPAFSLYTPGNIYIKAIVVLFFAVLYCLSLYVSHHFVFDEKWGKYGAYLMSYGLTFLVTLCYLLVTYWSFISWTLMGVVCGQALVCGVLSVVAMNFVCKWLGVGDVTSAGEVEKAGFITSVQIGCVVALLDVLAVFFICNRITFSPLIFHPQCMMFYGVLAASVIALVQGLLQSCFNIHLPPIFHPDRDIRALPVTLGVLNTPVLLLIGWLIGAGFARERFLLSGPGISFLMKLTGTLLTVVAPLIVRAAANALVQIMYRWEKWFGPDTQYS